MYQENAIVQSDTLELLYLFIGPVDSTYCTDKRRHMYLQLVPLFAGL